MPSVMVAFRCLTDAELLRVHEKIWLTWGRSWANLNDSVKLGPNYKKILRLSYDVIITYELKVSRKIIIRCFCN